MKRWLARLSFSFIILAAVLAWTGYTESKKPNRAAISTVCYLAAGLAIGLGLIGVRERHRDR